jgi:hypothetical protein
MGLFPLHAHDALVHIVPMVHELRVAQPTLGDHQRRRQGQAVSLQGRQPLIEPHPRPRPFVPAGCSRPNRGGPPHDKVDWHDQASITNAHHQQESIHARQHALVLATPPGAHEAQLLPILSAHRVIEPPWPLPAALGRRALARPLTPERLSDLQPQAPQSREPGTFGQGPEPPRGPGLVPTPYATELCRSTTAKERWKQHPDDFAQQLVLAAQAPCQLGHDGLRPSQVRQGTVQGLGSPLCVGPIALQTFLGLSAVARSGFGLLCGVSFAAGPGGLLPTLGLAMDG